MNLYVDKLQLKNREEYEPLSAVHKVGLVLCGVAGIILSIAAFFIEVKSVDNYAKRS